MAASAEEIDRTRDRTAPRFAQTRGPTPGRTLPRAACSPASSAKAAGNSRSSPATFSPANVRHFVGRAAWDADEVRDDRRSHVAEHFGEPGGVLVVDETGFLKKGTQSCGVQRHYSGTAGGIDNCQVGVFLATESGKGHALSRKY